MMFKNTSKTIRLKKKKEKTFSYLLLKTLFLVSLFISTGYCDIIDEGEGQAANTLTKSYSHIDTISTNNNFFFSVSYLYWQALEKGLDANLFFNGVDLDPLNRSYAMNFNFSSGMKAGIGYNLSQGTIFAEFLTISVNDHKNISTITDNWDMSLDILDLNFYRFSYVGKKLSFAPLIAGRIYWIDQSLNKTAKSPMDELRHITVSSKSKWALGPKIGVNSKWITNNYLDFFCNLAFVLSYQRIDMTIDADDFTFLADYFFKKHVIAPELEGIIGFSLGGYLGNNNNRHALLICGYEARVFFQQNYLTAQMTSLTQNIDGSIGNLTLHGLTASFRFDF